MPAGAPLAGTAAIATGQAVDGIACNTKGHVTALYNGQVHTGNPRDIPLNAHAQIQLEVGTALVGPEKITFPNGL